MNQIEVAYYYYSICPNNLYLVVHDANSGSYVDGAVSSAVNDNVICEYEHVFLTTLGSCVAANYTSCGGFVGSCYCDQACYSARDCCPDIAQTCQPRKCSKPWATLLI